MKKILIIFLILAIIPAMIFAKGFSFGIGATASTGSTIANLVENKTVNIKDFNYGAYANLKILFFSANATLFPKFDGSETVRFIGDLGANFAIDVFMLRIQAGLSINYFGNETKFKDWTFQFEADNIKDAPLNIRAEVDLVLDNLNIGIWGLLPTEATLMSLDKIVDVKENNNIKTAYEIGW